MGSARYAGPSGVQTLLSGLGFLVMVPVFLTPMFLADQRPVVEVRGGETTYRPSPARARVGWQAALGFAAAGVALGWRFRRSTPICSAAIGMVLGSCGVAYGSYDDYHSDVTVTPTSVTAIDRGWLWNTRRTLPFDRYEVSIARRRREAPYLLGRPRDGSGEVVRLRLGGGLEPLVRERLAKATRPRGA